MLSFEWSWMFLCLPLPLLVRQFMKPTTLEDSARLQVPFLDDLQVKEVFQLRQTPIWILGLAALSWVALITAAARPQWVGEVIELPLEGRDIMLAVDLSGSMKERDFVLNRRWVNRLVATKAVASEFIEQREGDRVGLILFGTQAYLQAPLTFDRETVKTLLLEAELGLAGDKTAIGDAITLAVKRLTERDDIQPILILLTDGANTAGRLSPEKAADLAKMKGIKIYTIGVGSNRGWNDLDETTLRSIAKKTGGQFFKAKDTKQLADVYQLVDRLEQSEHEGNRYRPIDELFVWPLSAAFLLLMLTGFFRMRQAR